VTQDAPCAPGPARAARGLTLLEVLAALAIFAVVMTVLIGTSTSAVHRAAVSARRLEANLLADAVVADLEIQMRQGVAPVVDRTEWKTEDEQYLIRLLNRTLQEALAAPTTTLAEEADGAASPPPAGPGATQIGGGAGIGTLLAGELPEVAKHLRQYDVEVSWMDVDGPESLTRTTFAFDWQAAKLEYAALFEAAGGAAGEDAEGDAEEAGDDDGRTPQPPNPPGGGPPTP
jgi:prepilin-type N-terminal cleavage/methylation domain-containing protein